MDRIAYAARLITALRVSFFVVLLVALLLLSLSMHTLVPSLSGMMSSESFTLGVAADKNSGDMSLLLKGRPQNHGLLGFTLFIELAVLDCDRTAVSKNSTRAYIDPGSTEEFVLWIDIASIEMVEHSLLKNAGDLEVDLRLGTLADLVSLTSALRIQGKGAWTT